MIPINCIASEMWLQLIVATCDKMVLDKLISPYSKLQYVCNS